MTSARPPDKGGAVETNESWGCRPAEIPRCIHLAGAPGRRPLYYRVRRTKGWI